MNIIIKQTLFFIKIDGNAMKLVTVKCELCFVVFSSIQS